MTGWPYKRRTFPDTPPASQTSRGSRGIVPGRKYKSELGGSPSDITKEYVDGSIVPSLPQVSPRNCARRPLRERIPRNLYAQMSVVSQNATLLVAFSASDGADFRNSNLAVQANRALLLPRRNTS